MKIILRAEFSCSNQECSAWVPIGMFFLIRTQRTPENWHETPSWFGISDVRTLEMAMFGDSSPLRQTLSAPPLRVVGLCSSAHQAWLAGKNSPFVNSFLPLEPPLLGFFPLPKTVLQNQTTRITHMPSFTLKGWSLAKPLTLETKK